jgi:hypothetical protein
LTSERGTYALLVGQDHRGSMRALLRYAREPFEEVDAFRSEVTRSTAADLELRNGVALSAYPCRPEGVRGVRACFIALDELAFYTATDGRPTDQEMLRVARGRVATTAGKVVVLSSPYWQAGALWVLYRKHYGVEDSDTLVWQADAPSMNPSLAGGYLERMRLEDPEAAQSEIEGLFRAGLSTLFDPEALGAVTATGVREREPVAGASYFAHFDPSGGRRDAAALAIARREGGRASLDLLRAWPAPHAPAQVIAEAAAELARYGLSRVQVDRFGGEYPAEAFRSHGITATTAPGSTADNYMALLPQVNSGSVELLDLPELQGELRGLERRRGTAGRDRVDHRRGRHDDRAAAACGALLLAAARPSPGLSFLLEDHERAASGCSWSHELFEKAREVGGADVDLSDAVRIVASARRAAAKRSKAEPEDEGDWRPVPQPGGLQVVAPRLAGTVLEEVRRQGGRVRLNGDVLEVSGPELPRHVMQALAGVGVAGYQHWQAERERFRGPRPQPARSGGKEVTGRW